MFDDSAWRTVPLQGVSMHHDFGVLGAAWNRKPTRRAFNGWAQAIVRARAGQPGTIRVTAKSEGLAPAVVTVKAR